MKFFRKRRYKVNDLVSPSTTCRNTPDFREELGDFFGIEANQNRKITGVIERIDGWYYEFGKGVAFPILWFDEPRRFPWQFLVAAVTIPLLAALIQIAPSLQKVIIGGSANQTKVSYVFSWQSDSVGRRDPCKDSNDDSLSFMGQDYVLAIDISNLGDKGSTVVDIEQVRGLESIEVDTGDSLIKARVRYEFFDNWNQFADWYGDSPSDNDYRVNQSMSKFEFGGFPINIPFGQTKRILLHVNTSSDFYDKTLSNLALHAKVKNAQWSNELTFVFSDGNKQHIIVPVLPPYQAQTEPKVEEYFYCSQG